jgi:diaminohydroxyphosphoribosylaminopyrimidine deaminase/5-amino-6-(5-phosphoribosylamino)uracil reductase
MSEDEKLMRRALELAARGRGFVEPNPLVGAVIARGDEIIAEGYHERFGGAHAEVNALNQTSSAVRGATLYVTLEPCCHHGKTPPCTDAVIAAGVSRVVVAMMDPFEKVAGAGVEKLRAMGITVEVGLLEQEARQLNAPYLKLLATGLPYVHAKWAMTLDGKIATATGDSKWISGEASRRVAHELRGRMDAIIVGIGTVLADDPLLTARPPGPRTPLRVVLDSHARLPINSHLARTARDLPVLAAISEHAPATAMEALRQLGCECLRLPRNEQGISAKSLLQELGRRRLTNVLVEGGSHLLGSFFDAGLVDEVHAFVAPKILGGEYALTTIAGLGHSRIAEAPQFEVVEMLRSGDDCLIHARRRVPSQG